MKKEQLLIVLGLVRDAEGKVLLAQRVDDSIPEASDKWEFVGGNINFGESPGTAVVREVREESGLEVKVVKFVPSVQSIVWNKADGNRVQVFLLTYECMVVGGKLNNLGVKDEIGNLQFFSLDDALTLQLLPNVRETLSSLS